MILDILLTIFFALWGIIVLAAAFHFQKPTDMPEDFENEFPEKKIFDKDGNKQI